MPVEIIRGFITAEEADPLVAWGEEEYRLGTVGHDWCFREARFLSRTPVEFQQLRHKVAAVLSIDDVEEPSFANVLSTVGDGVVFNRHIDGLPAFLKGFRHVRGNVFLQLPQVGGEPVVNDTAYEVSVGDLIIFTADYAYHTYNVVGGPVRRIMCSFGFLVPSGCRLCGREDLTV